MPPHLTRRQRRLVDHLYRTGSLDTINRTAKQLNGGSGALKAYMKQRHYTTNLRRRLTIGLFSAALLGITAGVVWWISPKNIPDNLRQNRAEIVVSSQVTQPESDLYTLSLSSTDTPFRPEELTLENVKQRILDVPFGQGYLDRLLRTGKVKFRSTEVVYDPNSEKAIEFLERQIQLAEDPVKKLLRDEIEKVRSNQLNLNAYRKQADPSFSHSDITLLMTHKIPDAPRKVFVFELNLAYTDDDAIWFLHHEWCHAESNRNIKKIHIPRKYNPVEATKVLLSILQRTDIEEAICYHDQLKNVQNGTFNVSRTTLNFTLRSYTRIYDDLLAEYKGNDLKSIIGEQLIAALINPYEYRLE